MGGGGGGGIGGGGGYTGGGGGGSGIPGLLMPGRQHLCWIHIGVHFFQHCCRHAPPIGDMGGIPAWAVLYGC